MSLNRARAEQPASEVAASAVLIGQAHLGAGALLAQGVVLRSRQGSVRLGNHSAVLENGVLVGWPEQPVAIGQRTVFGHRCHHRGRHASATCARSATRRSSCPARGWATACSSAKAPSSRRARSSRTTPCAVGRPAHVLRTASAADLAPAGRPARRRRHLTHHPGTTVDTPPVEDAAWASSTPTAT